MPACDAVRRLYGCSHALNARLRAALQRQRHSQSIVHMLAWREDAPGAGRWRPKLTMIGWGNASADAGGCISRQGLGPPSLAFERFVRANYYDSA